MMAMGHGVCVCFCVCGETTKNENCSAVTFGGDYGYKDGAERMILSVGAESMILSACAESIILSAGLLLPPLFLYCHCCCLCIRRGSSSGNPCVAVCRPIGSDVAASVVDFDLFLFLFLFFHADGVVVSYLFLAANIGMTALSVAAAIILGAFAPQVETKMVPTTKTMATMNEMHHGAPSTPPSDPCLRKGKGDGNESKDGSRCCWRPW
jgi:hypothetical protein